MITAFTSIAGLLLSFLSLVLLRPAIPMPWRWQRRGAGLHVGLWLWLHVLLTLLLGRPWFATAIASAFVMLVVQVSNAKFHSLREAFVFQDFEYFTDAIRHPRLYIPFLGWWKFLMIALVVVAALVVGLVLEDAPHGRFALSGQLGDLIALGGVGALLLIVCRSGDQPAFDPKLDQERLGLLGNLWDYAWEERQPLVLPTTTWDGAKPPRERPDMIVVQSESFFDARQLFSGVRNDVLSEFDRLRQESICFGPLNVPAWGANTVRSEFAFLSGVDEAGLGVHRFNPYRKLLAGKVPTLIPVLKAAGYRTVCIHPYPASFYGRDRVFPFLGFDEFIDIRKFNGATRCGPYVADAAVAAMVETVLEKSTQPVFIFVITMENHGPLHLEKPAPGDSSSLYSVEPPTGCDDLTVYLRHLRNADRMMGMLRNTLKVRTRPSRLCWYGDHVPIMSNVYRQLGTPSGRTGYFIWDNGTVLSNKGEADVSLYQLGRRLLEA